MDLAKQFSGIKFVPDTHQYFLDGEEYISVSSLMEKFIKPFDRETISKKVADRNGLSQIEVKTLWDIRRDFSTVKGTEFHLYVEKYLQENRCLETITPIENEIKQFHQFWDEKAKKKYDVLEVELVLYDRELKFAGTLDCLLRNKESNKVYIIDWKTNQEIKRENKFENFLFPIEHLEASNFNRYSLQTGFYRYMLEKYTDIQVAGSHLVHFYDSKKAEVISCLDFSKEIEKILKVIKGNLKDLKSPLGNIE